MKRVKLRLTGYGEVLKESTEKRLEQEEDYQVPTCSNGKTAEFYDDIGIPIPSDLVAKLKKQDKGVDLEEDYFETVYSDVSVFDDEIVFKVTDEEWTTLFIRGGYTISVLESCDEIDEYIEYQNRNILERVIDYILFLTSSIFKQKQKNGK